MPAYNLNTTGVVTCSVLLTMLKLVTCLFWPKFGGELKSFALQVQNINCCLSVVGEKGIEISQKLSTVEPHTLPQTHVLV